MNYLLISALAAIFLYYDWKLNWRQHNEKCD